MRRFNISDPSFTYEDDEPEGYRSGMNRFGRALGATATGTTIYELPPGQAVCPYHWEAGEEEWLLVLQGRPTLRTPEGEEQLVPMDVVFFPTGPDGAHKLTNETDETVRVLMWGEVAYPGVSVYPDSDKVGAWPGHGIDGTLFVRTSAVPYFHGEA